MQSLEALKPWQGFYSVAGSASATLVGLLFVAASVGSGVFTPEKQHGLRAFLSPTVVHFSSVLAACLFALAPVGNWLVAGLLISGEGLFGLVYAGLVWRSMVRHGFITSIDLEDRLCYAAFPAFAYLVIAAAGVVLLLGIRIGCELLAVGVGLLMLIGIRNAWDMTVWAVMRRSE